MLRSAPLALRRGPFTIYLKSLQGCPDLSQMSQALSPGRPVMWCDSARTHAVTGRWSLFGYDPWLTLSARHGQVELRTSAATHRWRTHPLEALRQVLHRYQTPSSPEPQGRALGLMGFLSYDLNRWIETLPAPKYDEHALPEMVWFGMRITVLIDHLQQRSWVVSVVDPHQPVALARREAIEALEQAEWRLAQSSQREPASLSNQLILQATTTQVEFQTMVCRALEHIRAGDIFQANVSQRFTAPWHEPTLPLYLHLRRINPSPFACWLSCDELDVVSCSPERLVRVQEGRVDTRPIAGTRPRGASPNEDALNSLELLLSEKERAEHIMLVDLARNDLGRVSAPGSVTVNELMTLEDYSHVIHIVSDVSGLLRKDVDVVDVIRAVFPGGTITGCPKVRCMEILHAIEPVARGLYTGSLGYIGFDGMMDLNIAIRTMVIRHGQLSFHVGAGIVADSDPEREYDETLAKAGALVSALRATQGSAQGSPVRQSRSPGRAGLGGQGICPEPTALPGSGHCERGAGAGPPTILAGAGNPERSSKDAATR